MFMRKKDIRPREKGGEKKWIKGVGGVEKERMIGESRGDNQIERKSHTIRALAELNNGIS